MKSGIRKLLIACHFVAFFISMSIWWVIPSTMYDDAVYMMLISSYVIVANMSRREILPAMFILLFAYAVNWTVTYPIYDRQLDRQIMLYGFWFVFNLALSWLLFKYHCSPRLLQLVGAQFKRMWIPQVLAICIILSFSSISILCVLAELVAYKIEPTWFSQDVAPFFYGAYKYTSNVFSCLMMLGVWSMMLDAHYLKARLDHKKNSVGF